MKVTSDVGPWSVVPEWVLDADVSDRAVRLYAVLGRYANANGESFPSRQTLAKRLRCSESSAIRASRELVNVGALRITGRTDQTNVYHLSYAIGGVTRDTTPPVTHDTQNENHLEREEQLLAPAAQNGHKQNPIWDALTTMFGPAVTRTEQTARGKVVASLKAAGATPEEMYARAKRWPRHFDGATLTQHALEKHWSTLDPARKPLRRQ